MHLKKTLADIIMTAGEVENLKDIYVPKNDSEMDEFLTNLLRVYLQNRDFVLNFDEFLRLINMCNKVFRLK